MSNRNDLKLIQNYHSGSLSDLEKTTVEIRLENDLDFKDLYSNVLGSENLLRYRELLSVKAELDRIDYTKFENESPKNGSNKLIISTLIGVILLGGGIIYFKNSDDNKVKLSGSEKKVEESLKDPASLNAISTSTKSKIESNEVRRNVVMVEKNVLMKSNSTNANLVEFEVKSNEIKQDEVGTNSVNVSSDENGKVLDKINHCNGSPKLDYFTKASCENESDGSIVIRNVSGEYAPYIIIYNEDKYKNKINLEGLEAGNYSITVVDNRSCESQINIAVGSLDCNTKTSVYDNTVKSEKITLYLPEQTWEIPLMNQFGWVEIVAKNGETIYKNKIEKDYNDEWNGYSSQGSEVVPGIYFYSIKDENNKVTNIGSITIIK